MSSKPKITGVLGAYVCRDPGGWVGYGHTPLEAFGDMTEERMRADTLRRETEAIRAPAYAPGLRKILRRLYGSDGK